jgi:hypothetical protein
MILRSLWPGSTIVLCLLWYESTFGATLISCTIVLPLQGGGGYHNTPSDTLEIVLKYSGIVVHWC